MKLIVPILAGALVAQAAFAQPPAEDEAPTQAPAEAPTAPNLTQGKAAFLTDPELRPDGPRTEADLSYEQRVLGAFRTSQGGQGPLDGRWHVLGSDGVALYTLQLTDPGAGESRIEGAWRNLSVTGPGASGYIETVRREGGDIVLGFNDGPDQVPAEIRLRLEANGTWTGESVAGQRKLGVIANRAQGLETASMAVPEYRNPPPPRPKATPKRKTKAKSKAKSRRRR